MAENTIAIRLIDDTPSESAHPSPPPLMQRPPLTSLPSGLTRGVPDLPFRSQLAAAKTPRVVDVPKAETTDFGRITPAANEFASVLRETSSTLAQFNEIVSRSGRLHQPLPSKRLAQTPEEMAELFGIPKFEMPPLTIEKPSKKTPEQPGSTPTQTKEKTDAATEEQRAASKRVGSSEDTLTNRMLQLGREAWRKALDELERRKTEEAEQTNRMSQLGREAWRKGLAQQQLQKQQEVQQAANESKTTERLAELGRQSWREGLKQQRERKETEARQQKSEAALTSRMAELGRESWRKGLQEQKERQQTELQEQIKAENSWTAIVSAAIAPIAIFRAAVGTLGTAMNIAAASIQKGIERDSKLLRGDIVGARIAENDRSSGVIGDVLGQIPLIGGALKDTIRGINELQNLPLKRFQMVDQQSREMARELAQFNPAIAVQQANNDVADLQRKMALSRELAPELVDLMQQQRKMDDLNQRVQIMTAKKELTDQSEKTRRMAQIQLFTKEDWVKLRMSQFGNLNPDQLAALDAKDFQFAMQIAGVKDPLAGIGDGKGGSAVQLAEKLLSAVQNGIGKESDLGKFLGRAIAWLDKQKPEDPLSKILEDVKIPDGARVNGGARMAPENPQMPALPPILRGK
jgi:hypothetical protein